MRYSKEALLALGLDPNQQIVTIVEELPELPKDYVRAVHLTHPNHVEGILKRGLRYEKYGILSSMAVAYAYADDAIYGSPDPRFSYDGVKAVVMDMPVEEHRVHENMRLSPGIVPASSIVGVVDGRRKTR